MRLFRRARDTKTSVIRREAVSSTAEAISVTVFPPPPVSPVAPVFAHPAKGGFPSRETEGEVDLAMLATPSTDPSYDEVEDSDVFLCETIVGSDSSSAIAGPPAIREVTLFVHGWHQVEPGLLSWTFPSLRAALDAVQRMKNAIGWCVVSGTEWRDLDTARARGAILVEQLT